MALAAQYATLVGNAQRCLELRARADARVAFGEKLKKKTSVQHEIARSRCDIEQARLLTMQAASIMDTEGVEAAKPYISMVKIVAQIWSAGGRSRHAGVWRHGRLPDTINL